MTSQEIHDAILNLDTYLLQGKESEIITPDDPRMLFKEQLPTEDQQFLQYNEYIDPSLAKAILGDDFIPVARNYRMCTTATNISITCDTAQGEMVFNLDGEEASDSRFSKINPELVTRYEFRTSRIRQVFTAAMIVLSIATVVLIYLMMRMQG